MQISVRFFIPLTMLLVTACSQLQTEPVEVAAPAVQCPVIEAPPPCPEPEVVEKVVFKTVPAEPPSAATAGKLNLPIIGAVEWASVEPTGLAMEARIDTGADTTSIHAEDIQLIERDGKRYVRFNLIDPDSAEKLPVERRLRRRVLIKQTEGPDDRRYVVKLWITLGETRSQVDVTLSDREIFEYPLLIGRNILTDTAIVDVSRHHTLPKQRLAP